MNQTGKEREGGRRGESERKCERGRDIEKNGEREGEKSAIKAGLCGPPSVCWPSRGFFERRVFFADLADYLSRSGEVPAETAEVGALGGPGLLSSLDSIALCGN